MQYPQQPGWNNQFIPPGGAGYQQGQGIQGQQGQWVQQQGYNAQYGMYPPGMYGGQPGMYGMQPGMYPPGYPQAPGMYGGVPPQQV